MRTERLLEYKFLRRFEYLITEIGLDKLSLFQEAASNMPQHLLTICYSVEDTQLFTYEIRRHYINHAMLVPG